MRNPFAKKKKSFYDDEEDEAAPLTGFYGKDDALAKPLVSEEDAGTTEDAETTGGKFSVWEWIVFIIEGLLILYTIGAFLGIVPPF
ncbi:hypothetical protein D6789_00180 [Candidatus Woesearchaeota archaeon]|nr:MAG: hypothetical protein D6789_00180 [Candidatus Woesearchaeota archaeon]